MDLGIAGRTAIICASSRGLGRACAFALAEAGCHVIVNGRDAAVVQATADEIKAKTGAKVTAVAADVATPEGQAALFAAAPEPDILVNNNAGPPPRDFRELTRQQMLDGVTANMIIAIELTQKAIGPMTAKKFGRIVNITSGTVKLPQAGLDLSSAARGGLTIFLAGVGAVAASNVTINNLLPGASRPTGSRPCSAPSPSGRARATRTRAPTASPVFRPSASAISRASARLARFCARRRPASSPGRTSPSTAAPFRACSSRAPDVDRDGRM